jgi:hypothetical protein
LFINDRSFIIGITLSFSQVSPRPRTVEDAEIFEACHRVMQRRAGSVYPVARRQEAGLSPATLVQRFGSSRSCCMPHVSGSGYGLYRGAAALEHESPLRVAREFLLCFAEMATTPKEMANHLAWLQMDLTDPVMLRHLLRLSMETWRLWVACSTKRSPPAARA